MKVVSIVICILSIRGHLNSVRSYEAARTVAGNNIIFNREEPLLDLH